MSIIENVKEEMEILLERRGITGPKQDFSLHVTPDAGRNLGEGGGYFKYVPHRNFMSAEEIARVYFAKAEYVKNHKNIDGKSNIEIPRNHRKAMMKLLPQSPKENPGTDNSFLNNYIDTNWKLLIYRFNYQVGISDDDQVKAIKSNYEYMPRNMIRFDLDIPDYEHMKY